MTIGSFIADEINGICPENAQLTGVLVAGGAVALGGLNALGGADVTTIFKAAAVGAAVPAVMTAAAYVGARAFGAAVQYVQEKLNP